MLHLLLGLVLIAVLLFVTSMVISAVVWVAGLAIAITRYFKYRRQHGR